MASSIPQEQFTCSFCKYSCLTRCEWKEHLITSSHQNHVRSTWGNETVKENCLVAFSYKNTVKGYNLKPFFKNEQHSVLNFLCWGDRSRISVIEFKTREDAENAFSSATAETLITFRKAWEMHDYEWLALFPDRVAIRLIATNCGIRDSDPNTNPNCKRPLEDSASGTEEILPAKLQKLGNQIEAATQTNKIKSPVKLLNKLAKKRGWPTPSYIMHKVKGKDKAIAWLCVVKCNGIEWARNSFTTNKSEEAGQLIAAEAYKAIMDSESQLPNKPIDSAGLTRHSVVPPCELAVPPRDSIVPPVEPTVPPRDSVVPVANSATPAHSSSSWNIVFENWEEDNDAKKCPAHDFMGRKGWNIPLENWEDDYGAINSPKHNIIETGNMDKTEDQSKPNELSVNNLEPEKEEQVCEMNKTEETETPSDTLMVPPQVNCIICPTCGNSKQRNKIKKVKSSYVVALEKMADENGWSKPDYYFFIKEESLPNKRRGRKNKERVTRFACKVVVNGVEYQPQIGCGKQNCEETAMNTIAGQCLTKLKSSTNKLVSQFATVEEICHYFEYCPNEPQDQTEEECKYFEIRNDQMIPEIKYESLAKVIDSLKNSVSAKVSHYNIVLFGNWALKLKHPVKSETEDKPSFYLYSKEAGEHGNGSESSSLSWISDEEVQNIFGSVNNEDANEFTMITAESVLECGQNFGKCRILHKNTSLTLTLSTLKSDLLEVQTSRLLEYLCTFDYRCHHLITMVQYWSSLNSVRIGESDSDQDSANYLPDEYTLPWMVILFLCFNKIIPTPREILNRPHKPLIDPETNIDIGFNLDDYYALNWSSQKNSETFDDVSEQRENIGVETMKLLRDFFKFYFNLTTKSFQATWMILNTKDGECLDKVLFRKHQPEPNESVPWFSNMTLEEMKDLHAVILNERSDETIQHSAWFMTNPFILSRKFKISKELDSILYMMKYTNMRLANYMNAFSNKAEIFNDLKALRRVLHVKTKVRANNLRRERKLAKMEESEQNSTK